ncbi:MAG: GyrI-like domain-containing protein [Candidatus Riflebacteria bacterium]|nr:GyrI-like domain-containing protein [Candidatus Riflebacteria bacterium]
MRWIAIFLWVLFVLGSGPSASIAQAQQGRSARFPADVRPIKPFSYVCLPCTGPYTGYAEALKTFLDEVAKGGVRPTAPLMTVYWNSALQVKPEGLKWDIGYPVAEGTKSQGMLVVKRFPCPLVATTIHTGSYLTTAKTVAALYGWLRQQRIPPAPGPTVEHYLDPDPTAVPDERKRTAIWVPVRPRRMPRR